MPLVFSEVRCGLSAALASCLCELCLMSQLDLAEWEASRGLLSAVLCAFLQAGQPVSCFSWMLASRGSWLHQLQNGKQASHGGAGQLGWTFLVQLRSFCCFVHQNGDGLLQSVTVGCYTVAYIHEIFHVNSLRIPFVAGWWHLIPALRGKHIS